MRANVVEIRLLGEPAVLVDGEERPVTRPREQAVLARLAIAAPGAVPVGVLIDDVWGEDPPATAVDAVRVHVSNLRKIIAGSASAPGAVLVTSAGAYRLAVDPSAVDVLRLDRAVQQRDLRALHELLASPSEQDLGRFEAGSGFFAATARRTAERQAAGAEVIAEADLAAGRHDRAVGRLEDLLGRDPFRERAWELLLRSLHASGRRTDALRAGQRARSALGEVGMEAGPALLAAERAILDDERGPTAARRPASDYVEVDGSRIAFTTLGAAGSDLLFLHGGFVPFEVMPDEPRFARFLERLAARHRVILLDRRGIGMSDPPAGGAAVDLEHWVADCRAVLDRLGSDECYVLGHENGGPVAIRLAAEQPERVRGLVLHSTVAKYLRSPDHPYGPTEEAWNRINRLIDRVPGADDILTLVAPSAGDDPGLRAWLDRAGRLGAGPARARELHRLYMDVDVRPELGRVRAPVVVLEPARRVRSDPGQARYLAAQLPDAELQLLDSGDHLPWLTDADTVIDAVRRVVRRAEEPGDGAGRVLRALVGVTPAAAADGAGEHSPESCLTIEDVRVVVFASRAAAERYVAEVTARRPEATAVTHLADTRGTADDDAVLAVADAARRATP